MANISISHARHNEKGELIGGKGGDQLQSGKVDSKGEVATTSFYVDKRGWNVLRPKSISVANKIGKLAYDAANNENIGYNQSKHTDGLMKNGGIYTKVKTATDCSGLVRQCIYEATGEDLGNFRTKNEVEVLGDSGLFKKVFKYKKDTKLYVGDILVTIPSGHTVVVSKSPYTRKEFKAKVGTTYCLTATRNIRKNHSASADKVLKANLKSNLKCLVATSKFAVYKKGTKVVCKDVYEDDKAIWIKTVKGWIQIYSKSLDKYYIEK